MAKNKILFAGTKVKLVRSEVDRETYERHGGVIHNIPVIYALDNLPGGYKIDTIDHLIDAEDKLLSALEKKAYDALVTTLPFNKEILARKEFDGDRELNSPLEIWAALACKDVCDIIKTIEFNEIDELYGESLQVVRRIREKHPNLPLICFSGVTTNKELSLLKKTGYFREFALTTGDYSRDSYALNYALRKVFGMDPDIDDEDEEEGSEDD